MMSAIARTLKRITVCLIAALGLVLGMSLTLTNTAHAANPADLAQVRAQLLAEHNMIRASQGLAPLATDKLLSDYAQNWSTTMAQSESLVHSEIGTVRHLDPGRFTGMIAENIAMGYQTTAVTEGWRTSPGHYRNMMNSEVNAVGFGYARTADGTPYYTAVFAYSSGKVVPLTNNPPAPPKRTAPSIPARVVAPRPVVTTTKPAPTVVPSVKKAADSAPSTPTLTPTPTPESKTPFPKEAGTPMASLSPTPQAAKNPGLINAGAFSPVGIILAFSAMALTTGAGILVFLYRRRHA